MSSLKVIVMGVGGVGKSAVTNRFVVGRWIEKVHIHNYLPFTIDECIIVRSDGGGIVFDNNRY